MEGDGNVKEIIHNIDKNEMGYEENIRKSHWQRK